MRTTPLLLSAILITGLGCRPPDDNLIVPGNRVGRFRIGHATARDVGPGDGSISQKYEDMGLDFGFDQHLRVSDVAVFKSTFHLSNGLAVGEDRAEVISKLGTPEIVDVPMWDGDRVKGLLFHNALQYPGVVFGIGKTGKVIHIIVEKGNTVGTLKSSVP